MKYIVVTGSSGMLGGSVATALLENGFNVIGIDIKNSVINNDNYIHLNLQLQHYDKLREVLSKYSISHIIHLAALAHMAGEDDLSIERYRLINVACAENVFKIAKEMDVPVLFASTADVYGMTEGVVDTDYPRNPIGNYAVTKREAEDVLFNMDCKYTVMRFAPVYTKEIKRDIQKRYYLKAPKLAYRIGKGQKYEVCSIEKAVDSILQWIENSTLSSVYNVSDDNMLDTAEVLKKERCEGRADFVVWIPEFAVKTVFYILKWIKPKSHFTFLLGKAINPIRFR